MTEFLPHERLDLGFTFLRHKVLDDAEHHIDDGIYKDEHCLDAIAVDHGIVEEISKTIDHWSVFDRELMSPLADLVEDLATTEEAKFPPTPGRFSSKHPEMPFLLLTMLLRKVLGSIASPDEILHSATEAGIPPHVIELKMYATHWKQIREKEVWNAARNRALGTLQRITENEEHLERRWRGLIDDDSLYEKLETALHDRSLQ